MAEKCRPAAKMKKPNNKGFTLVELLVVLVIIAVLAAAIIPSMMGYIDQARGNTVMQEGEAVKMAARAAFISQYVDYQDNAIDNNLYTYPKSDEKCVAYTNFVVNKYQTTELSKLTESFDIRNWYVGKSITEYLDARGISYYKDWKNAGIYDGFVSVSQLKAKAGDQYVFFMVIGVDSGEIKEFDYYRSGYLYINKGGTAKVYSAADTTHSVCSKTELIKGGKITSYAG